MEQETHDGIAWLAPINNVHPAARSQEVSGMREGANFLIPGQMMKEKARHDLVEAAEPEHRNVGWIVGPALPKTHGRAGRIGFGASNPEGISVGVQPDDLSLRARPLKHKRQGARPTTKVKNSLVGTWINLLDQTSTPDGFSRQ